MCCFNTILILQPLSEQLNFHLYVYETINSAAIASTIAIENENHDDKLTFKIIGRKSDDTSHSNSGRCPNSVGIYVEMHK